MRIHTDHLERSQFYMAAKLAHVDFTRFNSHGSRKRDHAFDVILTGNSPRRQNGGPDKAATWDQWGHFLGTLFDLEPTMQADRSYMDAAHFHYVTGDRFRNFNLSNDHVKGHKWSYSGQSATGCYSVSECYCGAIWRHLNVSWEHMTSHRPMKIGRSING